MKKNISILGSTGSIGETTLKIIKKKNNLFSVNILVANSNYKKIREQIEKFKPKIFIIKDKKIFLKVSQDFKNHSTIILNHHYNIPQKYKKNDFIISAIPGLVGLEPTIFFIKYTKKILLANKESIICGWEIISKTARKYKTKIIPIDSEHFSIQKLIKNHKKEEIEKIFITASGGPFLNLKKDKFKNINPNQAINHPTWNMGKKISIDSATMMNKVLEILEAQKIFPFSVDQYEIVIHPQSLVHAIVKFKNGVVMFLYHETNMIIPIANALFDFDININDFINRKKSKIGNLNFLKVDEKKFPVVKLLPKLNKFISGPIIINAANEILIDHFLKRKISYNSISKYLSLVLKNKNYRKYAIQKPSNLNKINTIDNWSRNVTLGIINAKKY